MLTMRPATEADCHFLAPRLRAGDRAEVEAVGTTPLAALLDGLSASVEVVAGVEETDAPVIISGVSTMEGHPLVGVVWALGSDEVPRHRTSFLRCSRRLRDSFHHRFPVLMNLVDARNAVHIEWLRWMGFKFIRRWPALGPSSLPFIEFARLDDKRVWAPQETP